MNPIWMPQNPFPKALYSGEKGSENEELWKPIFTQNTLNGWGHDAFISGCQQTARKLIDTIEEHGFLSPLDSEGAVFTKKDWWRNLRKEAGIDGD